MASRDEYVQWAHLAGVVGGALMLASAALMFVVLLFMGGVMSFGMMREGAAAFAVFPAMIMIFIGFFAVVIPVTAGIVSILGARRVRDRPLERQKWGMILIVAGVASFLGSGGFFIGGAAAIIAGFFALQATRAPEPVA